MLVTVSLLRATRFLSLFNQIFSGVLGNVLKFALKLLKFPSTEVYTPFLGFYPGLVEAETQELEPPGEMRWAVVEARGMVAPETVGGHGKGGHETGRDVEIVP
jgi:hypothetical protein